MKNILFISPTGGYAGIDVALDTLVSQLDRSKFSPIVVFPLESKLKSEFEAKNVKCYSLPLRWWFPIGFSGHDLTEVFGNMRDLVEPLVQIIKDNKIDIVFSNTSVSLDGVVSAAIANVPHVLFLHAKFADNIYTNMTEEVKRFIYEFLGRLSVKVVCCSRLLHEYISEYIENSTYIYNGVDLKKFNYKVRRLDEKSTLNMVTVGHYNENKNQEFVIEALSILKRKNTELYKRVHFTMIGPGEKNYVNNLKKMVKTLGIQSSVTFEGFHENINELLENYNLYINSSITENLPISIIEAMASGMPTLGSINDGTLQTIIDGVTGYTVSTPEEMATRIIWILEHPELFEQMSIAARMHVQEHFSDNQYLAQFETLFTNINEIKGENQSGFIHRFYGALTCPSRNRYPKLKVLVVYPIEASATYYIAAKNPLDFLESRKLLEYDAIELKNLSKADINNYDLVFCIRFFHDEAYDVLKYTTAHNKPFVWYIDDNYFALKFVNGTVVHTETSNEMYRRMYTDSSAVIVNNGELYHIANYLKSNVYRLPTYQLLDNVGSTDDAKEFHNKPVRFGFMGTQMRDGDFECVVQALEKIIEEYGNLIEIEFIGYCPNSLKTERCVTTFDFMQDYNKFRLFFKEREWDFALAPLKDTEFNRSKTNNKYREYSSYGIPGIYSDISVYNQCIINGENGFLVENTISAWYDAIKEMITNSILRKKIGDNAYLDIKKNYNIDNYANKLLDIFVQTFCSQVSSSFDNNYLACQDNKLVRNYRCEDMCFSGELKKGKKYSVFCVSNQFSGISMFFASEHPKCSGKLIIKIFKGKKLLGESFIQLQQIEYNKWMIFKFEPICGYKGQMITIELQFKYEENSPRLGVFEDRNQRTFLYKVFNKLGRPLKGKNVLFIDFTND